MNYINDRINTIKKIKKNVEQQRKRLCIPI